MKPGECCAAQQSPELCPWNALSLHREPRRQFSWRKERNFSVKRIRLKPRRTSTARTLKQPSDPSKPAKLVVWAELRSKCARAVRALDMRRRGRDGRVGSKNRAGPWIVLVLCRALVLVVPGWTKSAGESASPRSARSRPPASRTYIKVTSTSLIKR